jgi:hypothetical protein
MSYTKPVVLAQNLGKDVFVVAARNEVCFKIASCPGGK